MAEIPQQRGAETRDAEDEVVCGESVRRRRQQQSKTIKYAWE